MIQIILIVAVIVFFVWYLRRNTAAKSGTAGELQRRADLYAEQLMEFVHRVKKAPTQVSRRRLDIELARLERIRKLDTLLEGAEQEANVAKAIDLYLEALSLVTQQNIEPERKSEIEEKIKWLQNQRENRVLR